MEKTIGKNVKASALVVSMIILGIVLASALSLSLISLREQKASVLSSHSGTTFQSADKGIEIVMNAISRGGYSTVSQILPSKCDSSTKKIRDLSDGYEVTLLDKDKNKINCNSDAPILDVYYLHSIGTESDKAQRAVEAPVFNDCLSKLGDRETTSPEDFYIFSPFGFHPGLIGNMKYDKPGFAEETYLGGQWNRSELYAYWMIVQPDLKKNNYVFTQYDRQWKNIPSNVKIVGNISPGPEMPADANKNPTTERYKSESWEPVDQSKYADFVTAFVERYDGDGKSDMSGLKNPIKYWQVGNEFNFNKKRKKGLDTLQKVTYEAIKKGDPDAKVLMGGVMYSEDMVDEFDEFYYPALESLNGKYIDIFDIHAYGNATGDYLLKDSSGQDIVTHIQDALRKAGFCGVPIWSAEGGTYSGAPKNKKLQTERQQADDLIRRFIYLSAKKINKLFWAWGVMEGFKNDDSYFDHTGLIYDGQGSNDLGMGVKKLAYYSYKKLTDSLGDYYWDEIETLRDGTKDKIHLYRFNDYKNNKTKWVAWYDCFEESCRVSSGLDLKKEGTMKITELVPDYSTGKEVKNYDSAFKNYTAATKSNVLTMVLTDKPVMIEKK